MKSAMEDQVKNLEQQMNTVQSFIEETQSVLQEMKIQRGEDRRIGDQRFKQLLCLLKSQSSSTKDKIAATEMQTPSDGKGILGQGPVNRHNKHGDSAHLIEAKNKGFNQGNSLPRIE